MSNDRKRTLVREYKERKARRGAFAVRCAATGETWVSSSPNLDSQPNATWFTLRTGSHPNRAVQAAWAAHGEESFHFEILQELEDISSDASIARAELKDLAKTWREKLNAAALTG
ncbi:MAG: GIY-YIG nuclease family protein [Alphaproteobacteria bacterium]|nr:GIY-YIG nuclease family protein [Alphaproteobacteria bacterium]